MTILLRAPGNTKPDVGLHELAQFLAGRREPVGVVLGQLCFFENTWRTCAAVSDPPRPDSDKAFASLVKKAVQLAKSKTALGLPGYLGSEG